MAGEIAEHLGTKLAQGKVKKFADGEVMVEFAAKDVTGRDCYII